VAQLGSIYDDTQRGTKGPDLRYTVVVTRESLARGAVEVEVPREFEIGGTVIPRVVHAADREGRVPLSAPSDVPNGVTLRLRGAGGVGPDGGHAGDLYLTLDVRDLPVRRTSWLPNRVAAGVGFAVLILVVVAVLTL
jgi:hypothetical protein